MNTDEKNRLAQEIMDVCDGVEVIHLPAPHQYVVWKSFVDWQDGCDPDGYFLGRCPLAKGEHPARFNFLKGVMRCDDGCAMRPTMSLTNVMMKLAAL